MIDSTRSVSPIRPLLLSDRGHLLRGLEQPAIRPRGEIREHCFSGMWCALMDIRCFVSHGLEEFSRIVEAFQILQLDAG